MAELEVSVAACRVSYAALRYCFWQRDARIEKSPVLLLLLLLLMVMMMEPMERRRYYSEQRQVDFVSCTM